MVDQSLGLLQEAVAVMKDDIEKTRELSIAITQAETAILWRQRDLYLKTPEVNEEKV